MRPESGSSSICRRSTFPATAVDRTSTNGASPVTVNDSDNDASFSVKFTVSFVPTSSSTAGTLDVENPSSTASTL